MPIITKEEKLSGNRLIGEFMGRSFSMSHITDYKGVSDAALPAMKYHCDWSWLIPAWYRFRDLFMITSPDEYLHSKHKEIIGRSILYENIQQAFKNLCDGIRWHNARYQQT